MWEFIKHYTTLTINMNTISINAHTSMNSLIHALICSVLCFPISWRHASLSALHPPFSIYSIKSLFFKSLLEFKTFH